MKQIAAVVITALALLTVNTSQAEENTKQPVATKQANKARAQANRSNEDGPADFSTNQKESENAPLLDSDAMSNAAKETNDTLKKMDKALGSF